MKISNKWGVPDAILRAAQNDTYSMGRADISVTTLIGSPRINILKKVHKDSIERDVTDEIWSLLGRGVHAILERAGDEHVVEERLFATIDGWVLSGAMDLQKIDANHVEIIDYKVTSTYSYTSNPEGKSEWTAQLNIYRWLVHKVKGYEVERINICAIFRDWAKRNLNNYNYPPVPIMMIELPIWDIAETERYIKRRIRLHQQAALLAAMDEPLPHCTPDERWIRDEKWKVFKPGGKRALRTFNSEAEAQEFIDNYECDLTLERAGGNPIRCEHYCAVADFCDQWQGERNG